MGRFHIFFTRYITGYVISLDAFVNGIIFKIFICQSLLELTFILILYLSTLLNVLTKSNNLSVHHLQFCLIVLSSTTSLFLNRSVDSGYLCLTPNSKGKVLNISPLHVMLGLVKRGRHCFFTAREVEGRGEKVQGISSINGRYKIDRLE